MEKSIHAHSDFPLRPTQKENAGAFFELRHFLNSATQLTTKVSVAIATLKLP